MNVVLERDQFKAYLERNRDSYVGRSLIDHDCPLVNWLQSITEEDWIVDTVEACTEDLTIPLPPWALAFVAKVDSIERSNGDTPQLDGKEALTVLETIA
jgi:hypothetical protein